MRTCFHRVALDRRGLYHLLGAGVARAGEGGEEILETGRTRFVRGLLVALSNPKTIVFFTAFLPQFIDPRLPAGPQLAAMCLASVLIAGASDCAWAVAAGMGRAWFMKPSRVKLLGRLSGTSSSAGVCGCRSPDARADTQDLMLSRCQA